MDYEQRYKEALDNAKVVYKTIRKDLKPVMEQIFPELNESDDERIRKNLIELFHDTVSNDEIFSDYGLDKTEVLAWLEKQRDKPLFTFGDILALQCCMETVKKVQEDKDLYEKLKDLHDRVYDAYQLEKQNDNADMVELKDYNNIDPHFGKPIDKVEPKFKVSKWYQCTKDFFGKGVTFDKNTAYYCAKEGCLQDEYGCHIAIVKDLYDNFKLWTIEDAKDGDVLCFNNEIIVAFKDLYNTSSFHSYCYLENEEFTMSSDEMPDWWESDGFHPATKEQRELLFQKIKEEGYEWNKDKKKLIKL